MSNNNVIWYRMTLPAEPFPAEFTDITWIKAGEEQGLAYYISTHAKAYGEEPKEGDGELYRQDIEEGIFFPDKAFTFLRGDLPVGCVSYTVHENPRGEPFILVGNMGVPKDLQGKGYGTEIFKRMMNILVGTYAPGTLVLTDVDEWNEPSRRMLQKAGFIETEREDWFPGK
jgi:RimJ/RimL family protein N-acetyltransferase